jgi:hypothetical protein
LDARDGGGRGERGIDGDVAVFVFEEGEFVGGGELGDEVEDEGCDVLAGDRGGGVGRTYWSFQSPGSR